MTTKQTSIGSYNQLLFMLSLLLTCVFRPTTAFLLEVNFRHCEIHDNKAVWDLPKGGQSPVNLLFNFLLTPLDT
jgi:hypothetical protein